MNRSTVRLPIAWAMFSASLLALPVAASAQAEDEPFRQGLNARGDERWPDVVKFMRAAIQINDRESTRRVRSGGLGGVFGGGTEYMPHYLLGEAHFAMGECAPAIDAWSISEQQGAIRQKTDFMARLQAGYKECAAKGVLLPPQFTSMYQSARQAYTDAAGLAKQLSDRGSASLDLWRSGGFTDEYERAGRELEAGRSELEAGRKTRLAAHFANSRAAIDRALERLKQLEARFNATVANLTTVERQSASIQQSIEAADKIDREIEELRAALTPSVAASRQEAQRRLVQARDRLTEGRRVQSQSVLGEAAAHAASATVTLAGVLAEGKKVARSVLEQRLAAAVTAATQAFAFAETSFATLDRLTAEKPAGVKPELASEREVIQKEVDGLRRRFDRAVRAEDAGSVEATARLTAESVSRLDALITSFGPVTLRDRGVVAALEDGARLFFNGEYQQALDALGPASTRTDVRLQVHVHLFRAASLYALFIRSGETDQRLRTDAVAAVERCRELDPAFAPDPAYFSPRFIAFYREGASASQSAAAPPPR